MLEDNLLQNKFTAPQQAVQLKSEVEECPTDPETGLPFECPTDPDSGQTLECPIDPETGLPVNTCSTKIEYSFLYPQSPSLEQSILGDQMLASTATTNSWCYPAQTQTSWFEGILNMGAEWSIFKTDLQYQYRSIMFVQNTDLLDDSKFQEFADQKVLFTFSTMEYNNVGGSIQSPGVSYSSSFVLDPQRNGPLNDETNQLVFKLGIFSFGPKEASEAWCFGIYKFFVIREFNLNQRFEPIEYAFYNENGKDSNQVVRPIYSTEFTDYTHTSDASKGCPVRTSYASQNSLKTIFMVPTTQPKALISSIFIQIGKDNADDFKFVIQTAIYDSTSDLWTVPTDSTNEISIIDSISSSKKTGSFLFDFTVSSPFSEPVALANTNFIFAKNTGRQQVCSVQLFGWYFCQIVDFTPYPTLNIRRRETKSLAIGKLTTYYDPELQKQNPAFCSLGFSQTTIDVVDSNNVNVLSSVKFDKTNGFYVDSQQLEITLNQLSLPPSYMTGQTATLSFELADDRTDPLYLQSPKQMISFDVNVLCDCCTTQRLLDTSVTTLSDGTVIPTIFDYYAGSGVIRLTFKATATCEGFIAGVVTVSSTKSGILAQSESQFSDCQTQNPVTSQSCSFYYSDSNTLAIFSNARDLSTPQILLLTMETTYNALDEAGQPVTVDKSQYFTVRILPPEPSNSHSDQSLTYNSSTISSTTKLVNSIYYIGIDNPPLRLKQHYNITGGYKLLQIQAYQIDGQLSSYSYEIDPSSMDLIIKVNDFQFVGKTSKFEICAFLNNQQSDCSLNLVITFKAATSSQLLSQNTPPTFSDELPEPDPIGCFSSNQAKLWSYTFPKAIDKQNNTISFELDCGTLANDIFIQQKHQDIFKLFLDTTQPELEEESFECQVTLRDYFAASTTYTIRFENLCFLFSFDSKAVQPVPTIRNISSSGEVVVSWNVAMIVPNPGSRKLQLPSQNPLNDCFDLQIVPGRGQIYSYERDLNFTFNVQMKTNRTDIQVYFSTPAAISTGPVPDQLEIHFKKQSCFISNTGARMNSSVSLKHRIPRQKTGGALQIPEWMRTTIKAATVLSVFILVINFFLRALLNRILSSITSLGIMFHMFLVTLNYPLEMMDFFGLIFPLITFDLIPLDSVYERIFHFSSITTDTALTDQFDNSGYSSLFMVKNIGSLFLLSILQLVLTSLLWFSRKFKPFSRLKYIQARLDAIATDTLWNGLIQLIANNYLLFCVVSFIQSTDFRFGEQYSKTEHFCSMLAILGICLAVGFPLFIFILYMKKLRWINPKLNTDQKIASFIPERLDKLVKKQKQDEMQKGDSLLVQLLNSKQHRDFINQFGFLIQGLKLKRLGALFTVMTPIIDLLLRLLIAVSVTRLINWPVFTIFVFNFATLSSVEYITYFSPFEDRTEQVRATFNGVSYLFLNYHLFLFTEYTDLSIYPLIAKSVIGLLWISIGVNILLTVPNSFSAVLPLLKRQFLKLRKNKRRKNIQQRLAQQVVDNMSQINIEDIQVQDNVLADIENNNWQIHLKRDLFHPNIPQVVDELVSISEEHESNSFSSDSDYENSLEDTPLQKRESSTDDLSEKENYSQILQLNERKQEDEMIEAGVKMLSQISNKLIQTVQHSILLTKRPQTLQTTSILSRNNNNSVESIRLQQQKYKQAIKKDLIAGTKLRQETTPKNVVTVKTKPTKLAENLKWFNQKYERKNPQNVKSIWPSKINEKPKSVIQPAKQSNSPTRVAENQTRVELQEKIEKLKMSYGWK